MNIDAVVKIGGSLSRGPGLTALCREIRNLGERHSILVVPGGGDFADQVRAAYRKYDLSETTAHLMALLAMDQYGYLLGGLIQSGCRTTDVEYAVKSAQQGRVVVLLPSAIIIEADPLPHSWDVTSDTIAAWIAHHVRSRRLILIKDVDGLLHAGRLIEEMTLEQLIQHAGGVDEYLSHILSAIGLETWIINGLHPERLLELLETGCTAGTKILPSMT